jgi:putative membrane protein
VSAPSLQSLLVSDWRLAPDVDALAAAALSAYVVSARRVRGRWPWRRTASFAAGLACIVTATQSGLGRFDDRLLSAHMAQHMLLLVLSPPLLLGGRPLLLALRSCSPPRARRLLSRLRRLDLLTHPLCCLSLFAVILSAAHLPGFYDATLNAPALHDAEHAAFLLAGVLLWWPLVGGDPLRTRRLSAIAQLAYLFAGTVPMALIGAYLDRAPTEVYGAYSATARALGASPLADQATAGAIMWVLGTVAMAAVGLWSTLGVLVEEERRLAARERRSALEGMAPVMARENVP